MPALAPLFRFDVDPRELVLRGTLMYWFIFGLFRVVLRRDVGSLAIADVLLLVLIADAAQNAMAGGYETVAEGMVLVGTIAAWNTIVDWVSFRFPRIRHLLLPPPLKLVENGQLLRRQMRREFISTDELMSQLREQGISDLADVKLAYMESDGEISIIRRDGHSDTPSQTRRSTLP